MVSKESIYADYSGDFVGTNDQGDCKTELIEPRDKIVEVHTDFNDSGELRRLKITFASEKTIIFGDYTGSWNPSLQGLDFSSKVD